jgi:hypothetical protein
MVALLSFRKILQRHAARVTRGCAMHGSHANTAMVSRMEEPMGHYGDVR